MMFLLGINKFIYFVPFHSVLIYSTNVKQYTLSYQDAKSLKTKIRFYKISHAGCTTLTIYTILLLLIIITIIIIMVLL